MGKDYASKMCGFKCRLEDLIEEYAEMRPSERVAAAMLPLIACYVFKTKKIESSREPYSFTKTLIICVVIAFFIGMCYSNHK